MLRVTDVNKAATTMWDFDSTTLGYFLFLCCGLSLRAENQRTYVGVMQSQGMHPQTRETSNLCRDEYQRQADGQRGDETDV